MWKCEHCGREFVKANQSHSCGRVENSVDAYIAARPKDVQGILNRVRETLKAALPDAEERISWGMPTYRKKQNIISFAAHQKHLGLYPGPEAIAHFAGRMKDCRTSKGAAQFPYDKPLPLSLIAEIAQWCEATGNHH